MDIREIKTKEDLERLFQEIGVELPGERAMIHIALAAITCDLIGHIDRLQKVIELGDGMAEDPTWGNSFAGNDVPDDKIYVAINRSGIREALARLYDAVHLITNAIEPNPERAFAANDEKSFQEMREMLGSKISTLSKMAYMRRKAGV